MFMRNAIRWFFAVLVVALGSTFGFAADGPQEAIKEKMLEALRLTAQGSCSEELMSPILLDACEEQLPANQKMLSSRGEIKGARYRGVQELPNGMKANAYRVDFEKGSMTWFASLDSEGKLLILFSSGQ